MNATDFWENPKSAQKVIEESKIVRAQVEPLEEAIRLLDDAKVGYELAKDAGDREMLVEVDETLFGLQARMEKIEQQSLLSGKHDHRNCFVAIQAGAGGTEAEDWAGMLERMYLYYFQEMGWKLEEISRSLGPEAGISEDQRTAIERHLLRNDKPPDRCARHRARSGLCAGCRQQEQFELCATH
jgi:peptide chain release factor 2